MESIITLLEKIEAPLLFSSRDAYRHLPLIRDLETTIRSFLKQLENVCFLNATQDEEHAVMYRSIVSSFEGAIAGFDRLPLEDKKGRIEKAMLALNELRQFIEKYLMGICYA